MALDAGSVVAKFKADISEMKSGISSVKSQVSSMKSGFATAGKEMANAGQAIATGLGIVAVAMAAVGYKSVKVTADLESQRMAFKTLLGSVEEADKALEMIKKDAASTPFEMMGLINANKLLTAVTGNAQKSERMLLNVGKAIAATGGGQEQLDRIIVNLQQIGSVGKASMIDIKQFAFAGIPIFKMLEESTGKSGEALGDFISDGGVTFETLQKMFEKAGEGSGKFANSFTDQAGTFNQIVSNMKDSFAIFSVEIMNKTGIFDGVKKGLMGFMQYITDHKEDIINFITNSIRAISDFSKKVAEFLAPVINIIKQFFSDVERRKAFFLGFFIAIGVMLAAFVIAFIAAHIVVIAIFAAITAVVTFFALYWRQIWGGIMVIVDAVKAYFNAFLTFWMGIFTAIGNAFRAFYDLIIAPVIAAIVERFQFWASIFSWVWNNIIFPLLYLAFAVFAWVFNAIYETVIKPVSDAIGAALAWLGNWIKGIWNSIASATSTAWNAVKNYMSAPINEASTAISDAINWIRNFLQDAWNGIRDFFVGMKTSIVDALVAPFQAAKKKIEEIAQSIKDAADKINPFHRNSPSLIDWVQKGMGVIKDEYAGLYDSMSNLDFKGSVIGIADQMNFTPNFQPAGAKVIQQNVYADIKDGMDVETLSDRLAFKYRNA